MRIERLPEYLTTITVTAAGIAFALYCGSLTGSGQTQILIMLFGVLAAIAILLTMRSAIWVLIPIFWVIPGMLPALPIPLGLRDVVILFVLSSFFILKALKVIRFKPAYSLLDGIMLANLAYLATVFVRNPVGAYFFESDRVGGRPYLNVVIAFCAYLVLSQAYAGPTIARWLPWATVGATMIEGVLGIIALKLPFLVPVLSRFYGSTALAQDTSLLTAPSAIYGTGRNVTFMYLGPPIVSSLYSRYRPMSLLNPLNVFRFSFFFGGLLLILLSGFRSLVLSAAAGFLIASYFRGGMRAVMRIFGFGLPFLICIIALQGTLFELPRPAQRALSFLPGNWDPVAVAEAKHSSDWRFYMWKNVLESDRFIENKILGDGFGFSAVEMAIINRGSLGMTPEETQESYMVMGEYHSGPLTAIRDVGVVGLLLFLVLLIALAKEGWKLIRICQGGSYEFIGYFIGIPLIYEPFNFIFIYGGFKESIVYSIFAVGMIKMLGNSVQKFGHGSQVINRLEPLRRRLATETAMLPPPMRVHRSHP